MAHERIRLGGLWKQTSKAGTAYLTGKLGQARLLVFKNEDKRGENSPDFTLYIVPGERQDDSPAQQEAARATAAPVNAPEDLPF